MMKMKLFESRYRWCLVALSGALGLFLQLYPILVFADGGAPNLAYVAGTASGISVIDVRQRKVTAKLKVPGDPHMMVLSQDGGMLSVTEPQLGRVASLLVPSGKVLCSVAVAGHPTLLTYDLNTNLLYVAANDAALVTALDPTTCQVKLVIHTNGNVFGLATIIVNSGVPGSAGDQIWVAAETLTEFDDLNGQQVASIAIPGGPQYVTIPSDLTLYVTTGQGSVDAVDLSSHRVETLLSGGSYGPMDYDATTEDVYVPDRAHQEIVVLNPVIIGSPLPHEPGRIIHLTTSPAAVAITSDGQLGFVALMNGSVAMLDLPGRQTVVTIPVGGMPQFIITGLYPPVNGASAQSQASVGTRSTTGIVGVISMIVFLISSILLILLLVYFTIQWTRNRKHVTPTQKDE